MSIRTRLGSASPLLDGERVLHRQKRFRALSALCAPNYRITFQVPPLSLTTLVVTNRRLRVITNVFFFLNQALDIWFPGRAPEGETEEIVAVSEEKGFLGSALEIKSYDPGRANSSKWSSGLTLRFYFRDSIRVVRLIQETMGKESSGSEQTRSRLEEMSIDTPRTVMGQGIPWYYALLAILTIVLALVCSVGAGVVESMSLRILLFGLFFLFVAGHVWSLLAGVWSGRRRVLERRKKQ